MKASKIFNTSIALIFVACESILFYMIHIDHTAAEISLRYLTIQIAAAFAWLLLVGEFIKAKENEKGIAKVIFNLKNGNLLRLAALCTLGADYFLVASDNIKRLEGMYFFLGTQLFIFLHIYLCDENKKRRKAHLIVRLCLTLGFIIAALLVLGENADALAIISIIYYANLVTSIIFAINGRPGGIILMLGLILFALCDINVGLWVLNDMYTGGFPEGSLLHSLLFSGVDLVWIFYIPSQMLIPLSLLAGKKEHTAI